MILIWPPYPCPDRLCCHSNPWFARWCLIPYKSTVPGWIRSHTRFPTIADTKLMVARSEEHTSELQSRGHLVCRLLLEKKNKRDAQRQRESQWLKNRQ